MIILSNQAVVIIRSSTSPIIIIIGIMGSRMNRFRSAERSYPAVGATAVRPPIAFRTK